jgi:Winged helix DNA-binding domain
VDITWRQVLAWRIRRQYLQRDHERSPVDVARRLGGVQAQVASAAEQAVAVRTPRPASGAVSAALANGELVKTWAMRGTLHVLASDEAAAYLALLAGARTWERGAWQRSFLDARQMAVIAEAAAEALDGAVLTREELTDAIVDRTGDASLGAHLRSSWGAALKPLAWQGLLCYGPARDNRVTFTRPDTHLPGWSGLPDVDEAAPLVIERYLGAYGPATLASFDDWLLRGATPKAVLKRWFAELAEAGRLTAVTVEGEHLHARAGDAEEVAATPPDVPVRLLPAFDQYLLGPGTKDVHVLAAARRREVSRAAGWIAPVVVSGGRVVGTWEVTDGVVQVAIFAEEEPVDEALIRAEAAHLNPGLPAELTTAS